MLGFIIGLFVGSTFGLGICALLSANGDNDDTE